MVWPVVCLGRDARNDVHPIALRNFYTGACSSSHRVFRTLFLLLIAFVCLGIASRAQAEEPPYFVAYSHALEEPGNLELAFKGLAASPRDANGFVNSTLELEYGSTAWWTTELYLEGQRTQNESTVFTGFRLENRFRPLPTEHWINPVLYVEYENVNGANKSLLEIVGHDGISDLQESNAETRAEIEREVETKLILSTNAKGWNFSENFIAEKNLGGEAWEFGYALGASRPLSLMGSARTCTLCRQNFTLGAEMYGGLATAHDFGLDNTSHYAGPTVAFAVPSGPRIDFSPQFGLNDNSVGVLWRFKVSYEIQQFRDLFRRGGAR